MHTSTSLAGSRSAVSAAAPLRTFSVYRTVTLHATRSTSGSISTWEDDGMGAALPFQEAAMASSHFRTVASKASKVLEAAGHLGRAAISRATVSLTQHDDVEEAWQYGGEGAARVLTGSSPSDDILARLGASGLGSALKNKFVK